MILMIQNFGSKPKMSCNRITDVIIITGLRYFFKNGLNATFCSTTAGFRFFCIHRNTKDTCIARFKAL